MGHRFGFAEDTVRLAASENDLFHFSGVERGNLLEHVPDRVRRQLVRTRHVE